MKDNLRPLRNSDINPSYVLQEMHKHATTAREVYVVMIMEDGSPVVSTCGDISGITYACLLLQNAAFAILNGWEHDEWTPPGGA